MTPSRRLVSWLAAACLGLASAWAQLPAGHPPVHEAAPVIAPPKLTTKARPDSRPVAIRNFVDRHIFEKMKRDGVPHAGLATDQEFLRRVHLDLTGRLPEPASIETFLSN